MVKRTEDFQPVGPEDHLGGQSYYTEADIDRIIATCPTGLPETMVDFPTSTPDGSDTVDVPNDRRTVLTIRLEDLAASYFSSRSWQEKPTPSETVRQLHAIEAAGRTFLDALGMPEGGNPDDIPTHILFALRRIAGRHGAPNAPAAVRDKIQVIQILRQWIAEAKVDAEQKVRPHAKRNTVNQATRQLLGDLVGIWIGIFDQDIRTSVGAPGRHREGQAGGPMIRFIQACIEPLGLQLSAHAIRERIKPFQRMLGGMVKSMQQKI
jgi:hypothetical protein